MRYILSICIAFTMLTVSARADERSNKLLAENAGQIISALTALNQPLNPESVEALKLAIRDTDTGAIHKTLEDQCLLVVSINPEGRVKLGRGPAKASLWAGKKHYALVRIENHSGGQQRLTVRTAYAGADKNPFTVEFVNQGKLTPDLIGLPVEYRIMAITTSATGKHELSVTVEAGTGTQELGFRGEAPVLFDVK